MNSAERVVGSLLGVCRSDQRCGADPRKAGDNAAPAMDLWHENLPYLLTSFRLAFLVIEDTPIQVRHSMVFKKRSAIGEPRDRSAGSGACSQPDCTERSTASSGSRVRVFPGRGWVDRFSGLSRCRRAAPRNHRLPPTKPGSSAPRDRPLPPAAPGVTQSLTC